MRLDTWLILILFVLSILTLIPDEKPVDPYCEMVAIYQQSGGQYGWPDYRGNYSEVCKHETDR